MKVKDSIEHEFEELEESKWKGPIKIIGALIIIFLMVLWIIPNYAIVDPQPRYIPTINEVFNQNIVVNTSHKVNSRIEFANFIDDKDPLIKQTANSIASAGCDGSDVCNAKALFYFTQRNINYVSDPNLEYGQFPQETLSSRGGDCDDMSILLAAMLKSVGIKTRLVFIPRHVYVEAMIPDAGKAYKNSEGWVPLDPTCDSCKFGEVPYQNLGKEKEYLYV